jgi:hypothetical protein
MAAAVVLERRSVLGGVRVIADWEAVGDTHRTESRRQFCQPCGRATRPTCLLPLLRPERHPADDGSGVRLYFSYVGGHATEQADVNLAGCRAISAPGRSARVVTQGVLQQLSSLAPNGWRQYFAQ